METKEKNTIISNIGWLTVSKIAIYLLSIITITLIPRYLGVEGFGQLNFALSFVAMISVVGDIGLSTLINRDVARHTKWINKYFNNLFYFKLILLLIFTVVVFVITLFIDKPLIVKQIIYIGIIFTIFNLLSTFILSFYQALQKMFKTALFEFLSKFIFVIVLFVVMWLNAGVIGIMFCYLISIIIASLFLLDIFMKHIKFKPKYDTKFFKDKINIAWPFALTTFFGVVYFNFDRFMLSLITGDYAVGLYAISYTFFGFLTSFLGIFSVTFFPVIAKHANTKALEGVINKFSRMIFVFVIPIFFGGIYFAKELISLVFGDAFVPGSIAFQLILLFLLVYSINLIYVPILAAYNKQKFQFKVMLIATVTNVALNFIAIPLLGIEGAALTTILSELILFIGYYYFTGKNIIRIPIIKRMLKPFFSGIIMCVFLYFFTKLLPNGILHNKFDVLFFVACGAIVYFIVILLTGYIKKEDIMMIVGRFIRNKST